MFHPVVLPNWQYHWALVLHHWLIMTCPHLRVVFCHLVWTAGHLSGSFALALSHCVIIYKTKAQIRSHRNSKQLPSRDACVQLHPQRRQTEQVIFKNHKTNGEERVVWHNGLRVWHCWGESWSCDHGRTLAVDAIWGKVLELRHGCIMRTKQARG